MKNKHSITRWLLAAVLPALFLAACSKDNEATDYPVTPEPSGGDIRFEIGFAPQGGGAVNAQADGSDVPQTRVATDALFNSTWEDGDEIGIFAVPTGTPLAASDNYIHNAKLTYSSATGTWVQAEPLYWPTNAENMTVLDFYAYYPYNASATDPTNIAFNVQADQSGMTGGKSNYSLSDLLTAKTADVSKGATIALTFSHALAMVQVSVPKEYTGSGPSKGLTVTLRGVKTKSTLDLGAAQGSDVTLALSNNNAVGVTMHRVEQPGDANYATSYTYRALVPAQEIAKGNNLFLFYHEGRQFFTDGALVSDLTMTAGQAETFTRSLPASVIETVFIQAAGKEFTMGAQEDSIQRVRLLRDFYMSKYVITNVQYAAFLNAKGIDGNGEGWVTTGPDMGKQLFITDSNSPSHNNWGLNYMDDEWKPARGYENHPVIYVTWYGAKAYADWIGGALPTEARWEFACRAETKTKYYYGTNWDDYGDYVWCNENSKSTKEVGQKQPNAYGLYDMLGNVMEWCEDWVGPYTQGPIIFEPSGPPRGKFRVIRGGNWIMAPEVCSSPYRAPKIPASMDESTGFRIIFIR